MVLRKPYAFFIKMFKPIHLALAALVAYLITLENKMLSFFTEYIYSSSSTMTAIKISNLITVVPVILIVSFIIIFGIMYNKQKPTKFYVISVFLTIAIIVINVYAKGLIGTISQQAVSIRNVKMMHDLVLINISAEVVILIFLFIRGMGIDIKKFDFSSDIAKIDISDSDREEYELSLNLNIDETRRKGRKRARQLKYLYYENRFLFNIGIGAVSLVILLIAVIAIVKITKQKSEGYVHSVNGINFSVVQSYLINEDYKGNKITDKNLVVLKIKINSEFEENVYLKDFDLVISGVTFDPTNDYSEYLLDIGKVYDESNLSAEFEEYLIVYDVPDKYIKGKMLLKYANRGITTETKIKAKKLNSKEEKISVSLGKEISFEKALGEIKFKIKSFDIQKKYSIDYTYCVNEKNCYPSKEYLKGTINQNFDKSVLKLEVEYVKDDTIDLETFYQLFDRFGSIEYEIANKWYVQKRGFEEIKSLKKKMGNFVYIGVDEQIEKAEKIKLVFNIRNTIYEYTLK